MAEECEHDWSVWEQVIDFPVLKKLLWSIQIIWFIEATEETPPAHVEAYLEADHRQEVSLISFWLCSLLTWAFNCEISVQ